HPGDRRAVPGIELTGIVPDLLVSLIHDGDGELVPPHDTQHHAVNLGAGRPVEALEGRPVAARNIREQRRDLILTRRRLPWPEPRARPGPMIATEAAGRRVSTGMNLAVRTPRSTAIRIRG